MPSNTFRDIAAPKHMGRDLVRSGVSEFGGASILSYESVDISDTDTRTVLLKVQDAFFWAFDPTVELARAWFESMIRSSVELNDRMSRLATRTAQSELDRQWIKDAIEYAVRNTEIEIVKDSRGRLFARMWQIEDLS